MNKDESKTRTELLHELKELRKYVVQARAVEDDLKQEVEESDHFTSFPDVDPHPVLELDQKGNIKYINPASIRIFPSLGTLGTNHPFLSDWPQIVEELQRSNWQKIAIREVVQGTSKYELIFCPTKKKQIYIYIKNNTNQQELEGKLHESDEKYRLIVENSRDFIFQLNASGEFVYVSPSITQFFGYSLAEIIGHPIWNIIHPDDIPVVREVTQRNLADGYQVPGGIEFRIRHASGSWTWTNGRGSTVRDVKGNFLFFVGVASDITERKQMEIKIANERKQLEAVTSNIGVGLALISRDFRTVWANGIIKSIFGETEGKVCYSTYNGQPKICPWCGVKDVFQNNKERVETEAHGFDNNGNEIWSQIIATPVRNEDGEIIQALEVVIPITERKKTEQKLKERMKELRAFYALAEITERENITLDDLYQELANILPNSWQYPEIACARIVIRESEFCTNNFVETEWKQSGLVMVNKSAVGRIEVLYLEQKPEEDEGPFLKEERLLIDAIAERLGRIIERMQIEQSLIASELGYRRLFESAKDGILIIDAATGSIIDVNPFLMSLLGFNREEFLGKALWELGVFRDIVANKARFQELIQNRYVRYANLPLKTASGKTQPVEFVSNVYEVGHRTIIQCNIRDISERENAEKVLQEAEFRYRTVADFTYDWEYWENPDSTYSYVSPSCERITGYKNDEFISNPDLLSRIVLDEDKEMWLQHHNQISQNNGKYEMQFRLQRRDGGIIWIEHLCQPVTGDKGEYMGHRVSNRDVTERKMMEEEGHRLEEKSHINARLAAVGQLAAGIAHEINNPLTGVIGFSNLLLEQNNVPEDIKDDLKIIADSSNRVADIVRRLLIFARQTKPVKTSINLSELIENTLKLRAYVLQTSNIEVVTRFDPELSWSIIDPGQLQQVFMNLIINAEHAMKKAHGKGRLIISTEQKGNSIRITFQDDGPGIPRQDMPRLFTPFFTTKAPGEGTGLGLSLSRSIILEHGGEIGVESEEGKGATFIIDLPVVDRVESEAITSVLRESTSAENKRGRILVVDDEPAVREFVDRVLTPLGFVVDGTGDPAEAVNKVSADLYDAVLVDIRMPGMSGIEVYSKILEKSPSMSTKIMFITGDVMDSELGAFLTQNNLPSLAKPFDIEALKRGVDRLVAN